MKGVNYLLLCLIAIMGLFQSCGSSRTIAVEEGWDLLGTDKVNFVRDRDEIDVNISRKYTAIRFRVEEKDIILKDLDIIFENGDRLTPNVEETISAGNMSRIIELARDGRYIDRISFSYRSTGSILKGRAEVQVFGKRYEW